MSDEAQKRAQEALERMRGGDLLALSPERSEEILAGCFQELIDERESVAPDKEFDASRARSWATNYHTLALATGNCGPTLDQRCLGCLHLEELEQEAKA